MRKVDFFIVGAPKCASTSLDNYLSQHPEIYMSPIKDRPYYGKDMYPYLSKKEYNKLFEGIGDEPIVGESNTWYLYSKTSAAEIKKDHTDAKIIILIRNPVDFLYSLHSELAFGYLETEPDFEKALEKEPERKREKRQYWGKKYLFYSEVVKFSEQISRYFKCFGKDNVKVIVFEDLINNTEKVYKEVLKFIGVKDVNFEPVFEKRNPNKTVKNKTIQRLISQPPDWIREAVHRLIPYKPRYWLMNFLYRLNSFHKPRKSMPKELRKKIVKRYKPEVKRLEKLLDRNLSSWSRIGKNN